MISSAEQIQLLYEISLSIGTEKSVEASAKKALSTYIRKLNCTAGAILKRDFNQLDKVISIPRRIERNSTYSLFLNNTNHGFSEQDFTNPWKLFSENNDEFLHQIDLPDFGVLVLIKKKEPLTDEILNSLFQNNQKLASSLINFSFQEKIELQSHALESSSDAIVILDAEGIVYSANSSWYKLYKIDTTNLNQYRIQFFDILSKISSDFEQLIQDINEGKSWSEIIEIEYINEQKQFFEIVMNAVKNDKGVITNYILNYHNITAQVQNQEKLKISEERWQFALEGSSTGVWDLHIHSKKAYYSDHWLETLAIQRSTIENTIEDWLNLVHPDDVESVTEQLAMAIRGLSNSLHIEHRLLRNKDYIWVKSVGKVIFDNSNKPIRIVGTLTNINDQINHENEIQEIKKRFEDLADLLPQPIWEINLQGLFTYANKASYERLGISHADLMFGINIDEFIQLNELEIVDQGLKSDQHMMNGACFCTPKKGITFPAMIYSSPLIKKGEIIGYRGIIVDITKLKNAENELILFNELQKELIQISSDYIHAANEEIESSLEKVLERISNIIGAKQSYMFNYDQEKQEAILRSSWFHENAKEKSFPIQSISFDYVLPLKEKHDLNEMYHIQEYKDHSPGPFLEVFKKNNIKSHLSIPITIDNTCLGFIGFDFTTSQKSFSDNLINILTLFAQIMVNVSYRMNFENELKKAKEIAENAEKEQFRFLSTMSHEIRTPLNAVVGITKILLMENPKKSQINNLLTLDFSCKNLLNIVNDVLDYNKLKSNNVKLESTHFDIKLLVEDIKSMMSSMLKNPEVELIINIDKQIPSILTGDSTRITQILYNLLSNAIKFTEKGFIKLEAKLIEKSDQAVNIQFLIEDSGIGIRKENQEKIFSEYRQSSSSINRKYGGTGLGLPIVVKLLKLMGSKIEMDSTYGKGTTFTFPLKLKLSRRETLQGKAAFAGYDNSLINKRILLVEDNQVNQLVVKRFLTKWKSNVNIVENGQECLDELKENEYDMILMDLNMPIMDGYEATRMIRNTPSPYQDIPIIALTAAAIGEIRQKTKSMGFDQYMSKPFEPRALFTVLKEMINKTNIKKG